MTAETAATIIKPTEVVIEAFDAALSGAAPASSRERSSRATRSAATSRARAASGKKYKKCHGEAA